MYLQNSSRAIFHPALVFVLGSSWVLFQSTAFAQEKASAQMQTAWGLHTSEFNTPAGKVTVSLPADASAGDTLIGTVVAEPSGKTDAEKAQSMGELSGEVIDVGGQKVKVNEKQFKYIVPATVTGGATVLILETGGGKKLGQTQVPIQSHVPAVSDATHIRGPKVVQAGRPAPFSGGFDPNAPTNATIGFQKAALLAQSPRQTILQCPDNITGNTPYEIQNGSVEGTGVVRSIRLHLGTDKPSITKGETAHIVMTVIGVQGIKNDLPVQMTNRSPSVIQLSGGNEQQIVISTTTAQSQNETQQNFTATGLRTGTYTLSAFLNAAESPNEGLANRTGGEVTEENKCSGDCRTKPVDPTNPVDIYCDDWGCSQPDNNCLCHLIRWEKDKDGNPIPHDLGHVKKSDPVRKDGTSIYTSSCQ